MLAYANTVQDSLRDRIVLVTGASSGIGRAIAIACGQAGADLVITYQKERDKAESVAGTVRAAGRRVCVLPLDLADPASIARLTSAAHETYGRVDVWINNAGADILTGVGATASVSDKLDRLLTVDLKGTILASWAAADLMRRQESGGTIINMSWDHVLTGMEGRNPEMFAAVKGGVLSFSKSLARSVAPRVRVNILAPGWIDTAFAGGLDAERRRAVSDTTPLRRWGTPEDVAGAAVYLASPAAAFVTGQTILINGGVVM
jgi:3-oxoacyl-[acyl-carrier protein] reductase